ncbi:hypothetical protein Tco_0321663 [Tanacetum coccineum]
MFSTFVILVNRINKEMLLEFLRDDFGGFDDLLNDQLENELTDLLSRPVYIDAQTTFAVANPEGNLELTSYLSGASEVPFGTNLDVQAAKFVLHELFEDDSSIQAKAKKLVTKARHTKLNLKKAVEKKFKEYDQKLEAPINVLEAIEESV